MVNISDIIRLYPRKWMCIPHQLIPHQFSQICWFYPVLTLNFPSMFPKNFKFPIDLAWVSHQFSHTFGFFPRISHRPQDVLWDLGCGDGVVLIEAAKRCGCRCVGLDIDQPSLRQKWWVSPWFWSNFWEDLGKTDGKIDGNHMCIYNII